MDENNLYTEQQPVVTKKKKSPLLFIIPVVIVAFLVVFFAVPPVLSNSLASKGDYKKAISVVKLNPVYKSKAKELKYENYAYSCLKDVKRYFKNPDTISIRNVDYYYSNDREAVTEEMFCSIIELSAQNGFGGNTFSYYLYDNLHNQFIGYTNDLTKTVPTSADNQEEQLQCTTADSIQLIKTKCTKRDVHIDIDRLNKAVKSI